MDNQTHCAGCGKSFESYGMTVEQSYQSGRLFYCDSDCEMEAEVRQIEQDEWDSLSEEY